MFLVLCGFGDGYLFYSTLVQSTGTTALEYRWNYVITLPKQAREQSLRSRFRRTVDDGDLERPFRMARQAVEATPSVRLPTWQPYI